MIMERTCKKCGETKPIEEFRKRQQWFSNQCKKCDYIDRKKWAELNKDNSRKKRKEWCERNKDYTKKYNKIHKERNKEKLSIQQKKWYEENRDIILQKAKIYGERNKERRTKNKKEWDSKNKEKRKKDRRMWSEINKDKVIEQQRIERDELKDIYVIRGIHSFTGMKFKIIRQHPELIESWRQQIKVKRLLKQKKNENISTS
jgi:hypothetical protein